MMQSYTDWLVLVLRRRCEKLYILRSGKNYRQLNREYVGLTLAYKFCCNKDGGTGLVCTAFFD